MKHLTILLFAIGFVFASCHKEDPIVPEDFHQDIFRCKVNGDEWTPHCLSDGLFGCDAVDCQYYWKDTKTISIGAVNVSNDKKVNQSIGLYKYKSTIGDNIIGLSLREYKDWNKPGNCGFYDLDTNAMRRLTILEVDTVKYLIKGTFEFTAIDHFGDCIDTVRITDGYFHVNYRF